MRYSKGDCFYAEGTVNGIKVKLYFIVEIAGDKDYWGEYMCKQTTVTEGDKGRCISHSSNVYSETYLDSIKKISWDEFVEDMTAMREDGKTIRED